MDTVKALTILLVEDSKSDRHSYRRFLGAIAEFKCQILEAESLEEGIELWRRQSPDLVLMDVNLPDGSGFELLEVIKISYPDSQLPVIVITGLVDAKLAVQAMKLGTRDYLFKEDITPHVLRQCVINAVNDLELGRKLSRLQKQDAILAQISLQIYQCLDLAEIYQMIVTNMRAFLAADRVIIYQFNPDFSGTIIAESVTSPWKPCLQEQVMDTCFQENRGETYQQGNVFLTTDIYQANLTDCHLQLLEQFQVRANLVVPIAISGTSEQSGQLWGLLIAHQCSGPRIWEEDSIYLLQRVALKLAIALKQSFANQQLKTQLGELSESENRFRQLAENIHQVFYLADVESGEVLYISPSYETIWGRSCQSLYDNHFSYQETIYSEDIEIASQSYEGPRLGQVTEKAYRIVRPDGSLRWIRDRNFPIYDQTGKIYRVCGIGEDITERKEIELNLAEREAWLQKIIDSVPGMIYTLVRRIDGSFYFDYISPLVEEILEIKAEKAADDAEYIFQLIHPDDLGAYQAAAALSFETMQPFDFEWRIITPSGQNKWLKANSCPELLANGEVIWFGFCLEITKRKVAEIQLSKTEKLFREAQRIAKVGNWELDLRDNNLYWSEEIFRIFEIDPQNFMASYEGFLSLVHPDDREWVNDVYAQHLRDQVTYRIIHRLLMPDGRIKYVQEQCETVFEEDGTPLTSQGTVQDVTEIKMAELQLQELNQNLENTIRDRTRELSEINALQQAILNSTELGIISTNLESVIQTFNRGAEKMLGYSAEEVIGKFTPELFLDAEEIRQRAANLSAELGLEIESTVRDLNLKAPHIIQEEERTRIRKDGSRFPISLSVNPLQNEQGEIIGFLGISRDITLQKEAELQRRQMEEVLRESEARFRNAFNNTAVGMALVAPNGRFLKVNSMLCRFWGYDEGELLGLTFQEITYPEDLEADLQSVQQVLAAEIDFYYVEKRYFTKQGNLVWGLLSVSLVRDADNQPLYFISQIQDITQRREAEAALKESEMRFRRVFESDIVGMMFTNFKGEITEANDRFLEIIGYSRDELARGLINWTAMTPAEYRQLDLNAVEHLKLHRSIEPWEKVYTHKDGHPVPVLVGVALLSEDDDTCVCVIVDISDRKATERKLEESRAQFQRLVDDMGDKFVVFSHSGIEGIVNYASDGVYPVFGITKEEAIGKNWAEAINWLPEEFPAAQKRLMSMVQYGQNFAQSEMRFIHSDGTIHMIQVSEHPVKNKAGEIIAIEGIVEDITERKLAEIKLKNLSDRLTLALRAGAIGTWDWGLGNQADWDDQMLRIYGLNASDRPITNQKWIDLIHPEDRNRVENTVLNIIEEKEYFDFEFRIIRPDGELRWIQDIGLVQRDETGAAIRILGINHDISDRKNYETNLESINLELEKLLKLREEALTLREDMSNMLVHDLRNPLTGILLGANIAQKYLVSNHSSDKIINKLDQITNAGKRMQKMIDSLLLMAKLESGKFLLNPIPTDLHELGIKVTDDFQLIASSSNVQLRANLPKSGGNINIDATILRRIIENLISNALKFSPRNSEIILTLEYLPNNHLRIQVADSGPGISEEQQQSIFEKFEIGEVRKNIPQIGLGLAFCRLAVESQNGTIAIAPNQPTGSIFTIEI